MQTTIELLVVQPTKTGVGKSGKPYAITECDCIVTAADGSRKVGVLTLGRNIDVSTVSPGIYTGTFDIAVNYKDRRIGAEIVALQPVKPAFSPSPVPPKA